jgi:hypothetical protein
LRAGLDPGLECSKNQDDRRSLGVLAPVFAELDACQAQKISSLM